MAYVIKTLEDAFQAHAFEINGAIALRNYTAQVDGNRIKITSTENAALSILEAEVSEVEIDGQIYTNPVDAQNALQSIVYAELPIVVLTEAEKQKLFLKLPPEHPDANKIYQAGGSLVDLPTPAPKQIQQVPTYNDLPVPGEEGIVYYIIDEDEDYAWSDDLNDYYDYVEAKGFLDERASNLPSNLSEMEQISIMTKLNNVWRGSNNQNIATPQNYTESVSGQNNINLGKGSLSLAGSNNKNLESAQGGITVGGAYNENGGCLSIIFGGLLLKTKSFIEYAFGVANEEHTVYNEENWDDRDVLMHVGGGDFTGDLNDPNTPPVATERRNLFTLFKYGVWRWKAKNSLANTPTEILKAGLHGADENGRLNYYGGTEWKKYALEGEGGGGNGVTPTITEDVDTSYSIDPQTKTEHWNLTMTGDTDIDFTNMFDADNSKVITITLKGKYAFTFPSWLKPLETNDYYDTANGILAAEIVINIKNGGATPSGYYSLQMIDYAL